MNLRKLRVEPGAVAILPLSALAACRDIEVEDDAILVIYDGRHSVEDIRDMVREAKGAQL